MIIGIIQLRAQEFDLTKTRLESVKVLQTYFV